MSWHKKLFSLQENNSAEYQNVIREISSQFEKYPEKLDEFAVFKEELEKNIIFYFSPTRDEAFISILKDIDADTCEKPNLNNAKLHLGRFI